MKKVYIFILSFFVISIVAFAANELYINGANVFVNGKVDVSTPTLYVNGEIINQEGDFTNSSGLIEVTGDWTNTATTGKYTSTGIERFSGAVNSQISGTWNGTASNQNQFYDLEIDKTNNATQYVSLAVNVNINASGSLVFKNAGIIRTDINSHGDNGSAYTRELFLQNPVTGKFSGYSTGNGAVTKYIEGKLRRQINTGNYDFPIGVAPASLDGMEAFSLNLSSIPATTNIVGYIQPATAATEPLNRNIFCDIGKDPNSATANPFSDCNGGPDGLLDRYILESSLDLTHEWVVTPAVGGTYNYGITLHPGSILDNKSYYEIPNNCTGNGGKRLRIVTKNGIPGGDDAFGPVALYPFKHVEGYRYCGLDNTDLDISLANQTSFSSFRIAGNNSNLNTTLPIELVRLDAKPIHNEYIEISWTTASEINNAGFEVYRSTDGTFFESIGYIAGAGNSVEFLDYSLDDRDVKVNIIYYYKLKQIDFDGRFKFSNIVKSSLKPFATFTVSEAYPNPTESNVYIDIYTPSATTVNTDLFNALGQKLNTDIVNLNEGNNQLNISTKHLSGGNYYISVKTDKGTYTKKIIKN